MYGWCFFFLVFWVWKVIIKENRLKHLVSLFALMDYLTIIPFFIDSELFRPLMALRVVCIWRLFRVFPTTISPVVRSVLKLIASIIMLVYISAAFLLAVEPEVMKNFVTASYFATVTISTVGYGDIHMNHNAGRILVIAIILTAFVFIPWQGYFLSKIIAMTPLPWQRSLDVDVRKYRHVVLMGKITRQRVSMFLREFLASNEQSYRVVILDAEDQGVDFEKYIKDSGFYKRVRYYVGNPTSDHDLHRVHLAEASAAFVWSDTSNANPEQADRMAVLTCLAIKSHSYWLKVFVEVILPDTKARIGEVGPNMYVMSYQQLKATAISRACEVEGLLAFFSVLLTTFGPPSATSTLLDTAAGGSQVVEPMTTRMAPAKTPLGALPGHSSSDHHALGPSPAQLAEAALRRGESHDARIRAAFSARGASFRTQLHRTHGSHRSFHYTKSKDRKQDKAIYKEEAKHASMLLKFAQSNRKQQQALLQQQNEASSKDSKSQKDSKDSKSSSSSASMPIYPSADSLGSSSGSPTSSFGPSPPLLNRHNLGSDASSHGSSYRRDPFDPPSSEDASSASHADHHHMHEELRGENPSSTSSSSSSSSSGGDRPTLENAYREYLWTRTCGVEMLIIPATFAERTFSEASSSLYSTYGVLLIGVRALNGALQLNPGPDYVVRGGEAAYLIGRPRDVRQVRQTFERMARGDGTGTSGSSGKTLEYALDPRLEHSPFAPRSLRRSAADDSFVESVHAAAAVTIQEHDPFEEMKSTHHILTVPRLYVEALILPTAKAKAEEKPKEGPRLDRFTTFAPHPSHSQSHPMSNVSGSTTTASGTLATSSSAQHIIAPSTFGPPTPASRSRPSAPVSSSFSSFSHLQQQQQHVPSAMLPTGISTSPQSVSFSPTSGAQHVFGSPPFDSATGHSSSSARAHSSSDVHRAEGTTTMQTLFDPASRSFVTIPVPSSSLPPTPASNTTLQGHSEYPAGLHDHIIFCSHSDAVDWHSLIKPLRSKMVTVQRAVVIVTEFPIDEEQWEWLSYFPNLWVVQGSPLVASDLAHAQIESCHTIIVLSAPRLTEDEAVLDEKAIVVYNSVRAHFSHKRIFLDLSKPNNSRLVAPEVGRVGIYENPEFIAGHLYDCSLHDTIMAKSFHMPFLMDLTQSLLTVNNSGVSLVTVPVPEQCRGAHFDALFSSFPDCIPVGLLRRNPVPALRKFPYVCICPPQTAIVGSKDHVFLLAPTAFLLKRAAKFAKRRSHSARSSSSHPSSNASLPPHGFGPKHTSTTAAPFF